MDFLRIFFKTALDNRAVLLYEEALKPDNRKHALEPEQM
jgi:hypothetical protein